MLGWFCICLENGSLQKLFLNFDDCFVDFQKVLEDLMVELIDDVACGLCFEVHRACKLGTFLLDETDYEYSKHSITIWVLVILVRRIVHFLRTFPSSFLDSGRDFTWSKLPGILFFTFVLFKTAETRWITFHNIANKILLLIYIILFIF